MRDSKKTRSNFRVSLFQPDRCMIIDAIDADERKERNIKKVQNGL